MQLEGHSMETEVVNLIAAPILERVQATSDTLACKFVIVAQDGKLSLVMGPVAVFPYHANLVGQFCRDRVISYSWAKQPDVVRIGDSTYRILGGGYLQLDFAKKKARFSGSSKAYGYYDLDALRRVTAGHPFFSQFSVQIDS